ncbi:MAG: glycosyltransferase family 4 protein [Candidatus Omnitrophica bacterium]|jgi:glycosyltransferase involved in cell wall biosynthesis|nr:glycosyltransferase family 4 protein [Candidatus Omnitrophota bacterium]
MPKARILYIITKLELGGAQKQLLNLIDLLDKDRFEVFLFTAQEGYLLGRAKAIPGVRLYLSRFLERPVNPLKDIRALFEIRKFIFENKIDIVHTHSSKAGILGRFAAWISGAPFIIHTVHGWSFNCYQVFPRRAVFILLEHFCARLTRAIICACKSDLEKGRGFNDRGKYYLIPYGLSLEDFAPSDGRKAKQKQGIKDDKLVIGMIACFKPQKAPLDFVKAVNIFKGQGGVAKFILIGDGALRGKIERKIKELNLQDDISLLGWREDIAGLIQAMDIFVLTSLWEGLPVSVLEAMAASKPIVATNTGGIREVLRDGENGFLVKPQDAFGIARGLRVLADDVFLRESFGKVSFSISRSFLSHKEVAEKHMKLYDSFIQEGEYGPSRN